jgi:TM2 domain-containing membrane protein YozV
MICDGLISRRPTSPRLAVGEMATAPLARLRQSLIPVGFHVVAGWSISTNALNPQLRRVLRQQLQWRADFCQANAAETSKGECMYCSRCGGPNTDDARFCAACGQALATTSQSPNVNAPGAAPPPPPAYAPAPPPPPQQQQMAGAAVQPAPQPQAQYYPGQPQQMPPQQPPVYYQDPRSRTSVPVAMAPGGKGFAVGKSPGLAVFLSFLIPGVGQFYCGANSKGAIMLAIYIVSWFMTAFAIGFLGIVGVWIWSMIDAHNVASGKTPL